MSRNPRRSQNTYGPKSFNSQHSNVNRQQSQHGGHHGQQYQQNTHNIPNHSNNSAISIQVIGFPPQFQYRDIKQYLQRIISNFDCKVRDNNVVITVPLRNALNTIKSINNYHGTCELKSAFIQPQSPNGFESSVNEYVLNHISAESRLLSLTDYAKQYANSRNRRSVVQLLARYVLLSGANIVSLDLSGNGLTDDDLKDFRILVEVLPNLQNVALNNNSITRFDTIAYAFQPIKNTLAQLVVKDNPLPYPFQSHSANELQLLHNMLSQTFPNITSLNDLASIKLIDFALPNNLSTQATFPPIAGSFIPQGTERCTDLIVNQLRKFDAKDHSMSEMYAPTALFSLSVPHGLKSQNQQQQQQQSHHYYSSNQNQNMNPNLETYLNLSHNLQKKRRNETAFKSHDKYNPSKSSQNPGNPSGQTCFTPKQDIAYIFKSLPTTKHIYTTFLFDILPITEFKVYQVVLNGSFLEWSTQRTHNDVVWLRDFSRTYIITSQGLILNESLTIFGNESKLQEDELQMYLQQVQDPTSGLNPIGSGIMNPTGNAMPNMPQQSTMPQQQLNMPQQPPLQYMIQYVCTQTGVQANMAEEALKYANYNVDGAIQAIAKYKATGSI